ncbi:MAG: hypothetical protein U9R00_01495 [Patescibacteria group bacterium]|nr:hypothetical protein [Patescibacteria group bacterium]
MLEKYEGITPPQESKEIQAGQFESAIRKFFREQWLADPEMEKTSYGFDFDISDPKIADMKRVRSGDFEISNFRTSPTFDPEKLSFHFYVGDSEIHIQGKAADRIYELVEE